MDSFESAWNNCICMFMQINVLKLLYNWTVNADEKFLLTYLTAPCSKHEKYLYLVHYGLKLFKG